MTPLAQSIALQITNSENTPAPPLEINGQIIQQVTTYGNLSDSALAETITNHYNLIKTTDGIKKIEDFLHNILASLADDVEGIIKKIPPVAISIFKELCILTDKGTNIITITTITGVLTALGIALTTPVSGIIELILMVGGFILKKECK